MALDISFVQLNRAATERMRRLVQGLSDEQTLHPVGEVWTVAIALAHMAFWDRRVMYALDMTAKEGKLSTPEVGIFVNDLSLPLWAAIPGRVAARTAVETADACDKRLEVFPETLLEQVHDYNKRWVFRALHRNEHLDEVDASLQSKRPVN